MSVSVINGDCRDILPTLDAGSVHCVVTSPPYWGLRDYGTATWDGSRQLICPVCDGAAKTVESAAIDAPCPRCFGAGYITCDHRHLDRERVTCRKCGATRIDRQLGLEPTPEEYVANMVGVFREVRRVLRDDGTVWLNLGDSYASDGAGSWGSSAKSTLTTGSRNGAWAPGKTVGKTPKRALSGLKPKDLVGIPWMVARALQAPYYVGRINSEADRAWLAGWLDGEGTISFVKRDRGPDHTPTHDCRVFFTNTDREPMDYFAGISGGRVYKHDDGQRENRYGSRTVYRWQMGTHDGALLLRELFPHLRTKRKQASLIWTLYTTLRHKNGHARTPEPVITRRAEIAEMVRRLNAGEDVSLPSWVEDPPSPTEPGWYLRSDIIWSKPNPMPESVTDRPTKSHEYVFLLSKSARYYFDQEAVREEATAVGGGANFYAERGREWERSKRDGYARNGGNGRGLDSALTNPAGRNIRSVWTIPTQPYPGAHFATFPPALVEPCIKAGCPEGGTVLDPFGGSGTVGMVAEKLSRDAILLELSPDYVKLAEERTAQAGLGLTA